MEINLQDCILEKFVPFFYNQQFYNILFGGRRGGKSRAIAQKLIFRAFSEKEHRIAVIRNTQGSHLNSTYAEFKAALRQMNLTDFASLTVNPLRIQFNKVNSEIIFYGCDDPEKLKGMISTAIWWEEVTEIDEDDFNTVMAGFSPADELLYKQIILSFNPVNEDHWIKKRFFDENPDKKNTFVSHSSYKDNVYLPKETVTYLEKLKYVDKHKYEINTLGLWGKLVRGNEYYKNFKYDKHVRSRTVEYNPNKALHISFDFNILPYMTLLIAQTNGDDVYFVDEIATEDPNNTIAGICRAFIDRYNDHKEPLFVYGDPSGKTKMHTGDNNYILIKNYLMDFYPRLKVIKYAPSLYVRQQWFNEIFSDLGDFKIKINTKCTHLIEDLSYIRENEEGGKWKQRVVDKRRGVRYEKYGHFSDAMDYLILGLKDKNWKKFNKVAISLKKFFVPKRKKRQFQY